MTETLGAVWNGFLMGFKYAGIVMGFAVGAYVAFLLAGATWRVLEKITRRD